MEWEAGTLLVAGGLILGLAFGALVQASKFCFRSAVLESYHRKSEKPQFWAWIVAILVAVVATQLLVAYSGLDINSSRYLGSGLAWFGLITGGLLFGVGAILARGCGGRLTVLAASGNLRALTVVIVFAISAFATLRGILALPRLELTGVASSQLPTSQGLVDIIALAAGVEVSTIRLAVTVVIASLIFFLAFTLVRRGVKTPVLVGSAIGLLVAAGWWVTGVLAFDDFDPVPAESVSFAATLADGLQFLLVFTGVKANFGVALVAGVLVGAVGSAAVKGELKLESFSNPGEMSRYLLGGLLMGFGSVTTLGCTFGQGLSGVSTLSIGSILAIISIAAGMVLTEKFLNRKTAIQHQPALA